MVNANNNEFIWKWCDVKSDIMESISEVYYESWWVIIGDIRDSVENKSDDSEWWNEMGNEDLLIKLFRSSL